MSIVPVYLFAARRVECFGGSAGLLLMSLKNHQQEFVLNEAELCGIGVKLGDFVSGKANGTYLLPESIKRAVDCRDTLVVGDVAYIDQCFAVLTPGKRGPSLFKTEEFGHVLTLPILARGEYYFRVSRMKDPKLLNGVMYYLEATDYHRVGEAKGEEPGPQRTLKAFVMGSTPTNQRMWVIRKEEQEQFLDDINSGKLFAENQGVLDRVVTDSMMLDGGYDEGGRMFLEVTLTDYRPASGRRTTAEASAESFPKIVDIESILSEDCVGKQVRIHHRLVDRSKSGWTILEVI